MKRQKLLLVFIGSALVISCAEKSNDVTTPTNLAVPNDLVVPTYSADGAYETSAISGVLHISADRCAVIDDGNDEHIIVWPEGSTLTEPDTITLPEGNTFVLRDGASVTVGGGLASVADITGTSSLKDCLNNSGQTNEVFILGSIEAN